MQTEGNGLEAKRLGRFLDAHRGHLVFAYVRVNDRRLRDRYVKDVSEGRKVHLLDYTDVPDLWLLDDLRRRPDVHDPEACTFVVGVDRHIGDERFTRSLNHDRDAFAEVLRGPLVFWMSDGAADRFRRESPDFEDWHAATFRFGSAPEIMPTVSRRPGPPYSAIAHLFDARVEALERNLRSDRARLGNSHPAIAEQWAGLGSVRMLQGRWADALAAYESAASILRSQVEGGPREDTGWARILSNLGVLLEWAGQRDEALARLSEAEAVAKSAGNKRLLLLTLANRGGILRDAGKLEDAMTVLGEAERLAELHDPSSLASVYGNQARIWLAWANPVESLRLFKQQEDICRSAGDYVGLPISYWGQGLALQALDRLDEAMTVHQREARHAEERSDRLGIAISLGNQAIILKRQGRLEEALALHERESAIYAELNHKEGTARSLANRGLLLAEMSRTEAASDALQRSLAIFDELAMTKERDQVQGWLQENNSMIGLPLPSRVT